MAEEHQTSGQKPLFEVPAEEVRPAQPVVSTPLTEALTLNAALPAFETYMRQRGFAQNTRKAFLGDLRLLSRYLGGDRLVSTITVEDLEGFLNWLYKRQDPPPKPKTMARRITTLKVFFSFLAEQKLISEDPAAAIPQIRARTPLPRVLHDDEVDRLLDVAKKRLWGRHPDPRPYLLISLVLYTGIKKGELVNIKLTHIDRSNPRRPILEIRYDNPRMHHKERNVAFPPSLLPVLDQYLDVYKPKERLFEWTPRNLEYVLADIAKEAGIEGGVSFEMLRWTCAVRDYRRGMPEEQLRQKLGLSPVTWRETFEKIRKLASPGL